MASEYTYNKVMLDLSSPPNVIASFVSKLVLNYRFTSFSFGFGQIVRLVVYLIKKTKLGLPPKYCLI